MRRRTVSFFLAVFLFLGLVLLSAVPTRAEGSGSGTCGEDLTWRFDPDSGLLTIEGTGAMKDFSFGKSAPWAEYRSQICSLSLPEGLTSIGKNAFYACDALTELQLPEGLVSIGRSAFSCCRSLTELTLPESLIAMGDYAFFSCSSLTKLTLPAGLTAFGNYAFYNCTALSDVTFPEGLASIGGYAFFRCRALTTVSLPDSLTSIRLGAFSDCTGLTELTLPTNLTSIEGYAFFQCTALKTVTLPASLESVETNAFSGCTGLRRVIVWGDHTYLNTVDYDASSEDLSIEVQDQNLLGPSEQTIIYGRRNSAFPPTKPLREGISGPAETAWMLPYPYAVDYGYAFYALDAFSDVKPGAYYELPVAWAYGSGITGGTGNGLFSPNATCTRAQVVTFLWNAFGRPEPDLGNNPFVDVKEKKYYYKPTLWAYQNGITSGVDATHFDPNGNCTRAQVVTFLWSAMQKPAPSITENPFTDVSPKKYYCQAVLWAYENGITGGTDATHFSPNKACTRAQVVTFLYKLFGAAE